MSQVGVYVQSTEVPAASAPAVSTATAFIVGESDFGPVNTPEAVTSLAAFASIFCAPSGVGNPYSARSATNAQLFDAVDAFFREGNIVPAGVVAYISRSAGPTPVNGTLMLTDIAPANALAVTAAYPGTGGNNIYVVVANNTTTYTLTLQDAAGNVLVTSGPLSTRAAAVTWAATTGLVTIVAQAGSTLPKTLAATPLATGTDDRVDITLTQWQAAINSFSPSLGPGQILAPGVTNSTVSGIWSALGTHAQANNRIALCDMDDGTSVTTAVAALSTFGASGVASYCGFWSGNRNIPGVAGGTFRSVAPSPFIAALCAQVDGTGNPNQAAAGDSYPFRYSAGAASFVSGTLDTYSSSDLNTLNAAGINTFAFGNENYGFVSAVPPGTDGIFWQLNHGRLRMTLQAQAQSIGRPFVFSQIDGKGATRIAFGAALAHMLQTYYTAGALYGDTANQAFSVDVGSDVNTPVSIAAGQLNASVNVRMSPYAQAVNLVLNAVPTTTSL